MNARLADLCGRYVTTNVKSSASLHRMRPWPGLVGLGAPRTAFPSRSFHVGLRAQGEHEKQPFRIIHHIRIGGLRGFNWSLGRSEEQDAWDAEAEVQKAAILEKLMKGRQPADLKMRCTILDAQGNVETVSGHFKKSDLSAEHGLNIRDLRKIDSRIPNLVPTILVRKESILVNILHLRALIKADAVVLFDTYGSVDSRLHSTFLYHLQHNLRSKATGLPYEFRALESILLSCLSALEVEMVFIRNLVGTLLAELEDDIDHDRFKRLLYYSRRLDSFQNRAKLVQDCLDELLDTDEDLAAMYLTDKKNNAERPDEDHEEIEFILESFSKQVEEIVNEAQSMQSNVQSTQEIVELILDSNRNALLTLDLKVSIATLGIGIGTLIAGLFGMNLRTGWEDDAHAFWVMSGVSGVVAILVAWRGFR
ncbi:cora-domain-containing protein, partial [Schizophyllum commune]